MKEHSPHVHLRGTLAPWLLGAWQDARWWWSEAFIILIVVRGHQSVYSGQLVLMGVPMAPMAVAMPML